MLDQIAGEGLARNINPQPSSGKQERIENLLARAIHSDKL